MPFYQSPSSSTTNDTPVYCANASDIIVEVSPGAKQQRYRQRFELDHVFDASCSQEEVFQQLRPRVREFMDGYSATVLTYGQTGSGKTFTIQGAQAEGGEGIVPRVADMIFQRIDEVPHDAPTREKIEVYVSFLEIYQEQLKDLLQKNTNRSISRLRIRETANMGIWVEGLIEKRIYSKEEFSELFVTTALKRTVGAHAMNAESSRSHLCCTITIKQPPEIGSGVLSSKFHLVDLAGSETVRKTDASGERLNEAKHINKSLSALGNVISALTSNSFGIIPAEDNTSYSSAHTTMNVSGNKKHIPYRDSKLTRILQDSLAGNSKTILILTISCSRCSVAETMATLRFGERARKLTTKPRLNISNSHSAAESEKALTEEVGRLKLALLQAQREIIKLSEMISESDSKTIYQLYNTNNSSRNETGGSSRYSEMCPTCGRPPDFMVGDRFSFREANGGQSLQVGSNDEDEIRPELHCEEEIESGHVVKLWESSVDSQGICSRCAVCGLTEAEGSSLDENLFFDGGPLHQGSGVHTANGMGALFTCDGNCGYYFHPRCVGISTSHEGEWYCIDCSNIMHEERASVRAEYGADPVLTSSTIISRIARQYHVMRLERNRLMLNWEQERRIAKLRAEKDLEQQTQRDQEHHSALQQCQLLTSKLKRAEQETVRLRKSLDQEFNLRISMEKEIGRVVDTDVTCTIGSSRPKSPELFAASTTDNSNSSTGRRLSLICSSSLKELKTVDYAGNIISASGSSDGRPEAAPIPKPWLTRNRSSCCAEQSSLQIKRHAVVYSSDRLCVESSDKRRVQVSPIRHVSDSRRSSNNPELDSVSHVDSANNIEVDSSDAPATYLFPIRNRLKDLLRSVELEAGSFAEIRHKQKERELLRTSHASKRARGDRINIASTSPSTEPCDSCTSASFDASIMNKNDQEADEIEKMDFLSLVSTNKKETLDRQRSQEGVLSQEVLLSARLPAINTKNV